MASSCMALEPVRVTTVSEGGVKVRSACPSASTKLSPPTSKSYMGCQQGGLGKKGKGHVRKKVRVRACERNKNRDRDIIGGKVRESEKGSKERERGKGHD